MLGGKRVGEENWLHHIVKQSQNLLVVVSYLLWAISGRLLLVVGRFRSFQIVRRFSKYRCVRSANEEKGNREVNQRWVNWSQTPFVIPGSAAYERRHNEVITTVKTLDQLTEALNYKGYDLKCSFVYFHLLPRNSRTLERKRQVHMAPVNLERDKSTWHLSNFTNPKIPKLHLMFL